MTAPETMSSDLLPVDKHRQRILDHIRHHRVTIVQGETGCGKSTRIPEMIWESEHQSGRECRMFVSQPRRMAASALYQHMQQGPLGHIYGLRMGHGERIESDDTRIYFVTSGYLVQYMAHNTKAFKFHTHLIVDEVHERSVDSDMLCMLAKHLLVQFRHLRLIVMSATIQSRLYADYFSVPKENTLFVGSRRFPIEINYLDEFTKVNLPPAIGAKVTQLMDACSRSIQNMNMAVPATVAKLQYDLALLILQKLGTSNMRRSEAAVLVFVSGMNDICDLTEQIEALNSSGRSQIFFKVVPIHSELPSSAQENAWKEVESHELKVIIATNAAESSVTLPDVDTVICFGTHKQIERVGNSDQTQLVNTWIPKSGAVQRAGRTGRKRPGVCYRLYCETLFEHFSDYEVPEVKRQPLDQLVLRLRSIMDAPVMPLLETLIEPPSFDAIHAAFSSLYRLRMIEHPSDEGALTKAGRFVSCLGIDVRSGRLLADSFVLGMMAEAIVIVMSLALQHSPYRMAVPLIHAPTEFNDIVTSVMKSTFKYDDGMLSESMTILELYRDWVRSPSQVGFSFENSLSSTRIRQLHAMVEHLRGRVAKELNIPEEQLVLDTNQRLDPKGRLFIRLLLTWTYNDQVIRAERCKGPMSSANSVLIERTGAVTDTDIRNVFKNAAKLKPRLEQVETRVFLAEKISVQQPIACWNLDRIFRDLRFDLVSVLEDSAVKTFTLFCLPRHWSALSNSFDKQLSGAATLKRNPKTGEKVTVGTVTIPNNKLYKDFRKHLRFSIRQPSIIIFLGKTTAEVITCRCDLGDGWKHALLGASSEWTEKHSAVSEYVVFSDISSPNTELVQDCTGLGMKILTSICNGYRGAPLLKVISSTDRTKTVEIPVRTCRTNWALVPDLSATGSHAKAVMPRNSLLEGIGFLNLNQHPVFAIAANILFFSAGRDMARAEGVTILPQGEEWLCLALHCVGIECSNWLGRKVDESRLQMANDIYQRLKYSSTTLELPDMQLLLDIDQLFSSVTPANQLEIVDDASATVEADQAALPEIVHEPTTFHTDGVVFRTFEEINNLNITNIAVLTRLREMCKKKGGGERSYQDGGARIKYVCIRCNMRNSWKKVLTHMQTTSVCRRFVWEIVSDIEKEFEKTEEKNVLDPYGERYRCFGECGREFADWDGCLDHIKSDAMCYQKIVEKQHSEREHSGLWKISIAERLGKSILRDRDMNNMFVCPSCNSTMSWSEIKDHLEYGDTCAQYVEDVFPVSQRDWHIRMVFEGLKERCFVESQL